MRATVNELSKAIDTDEYTMYEAVWGEMHVEYDVIKKRFDVTPLLKGLPNDRDPTPHWGIIMKGQGRVIYADGKEETVRAGDAYYIPPGHTAIFEAGTEFWEFSPLEVMEKSMEVMMRNFEELTQKKR